MKMQWLALSVSSRGDVYELEIKDPKVKRTFATKALLVDYIARLFIMGTEDALAHLEGVERAPLVLSLAILPENIPLLSI